MFLDLNLILDFVYHTKRKDVIVKVDNMMRRGTRSMAQNQKLGARHFWIQKLSQYYKVISALKLSRSKPNKGKI